MSFRLGSSLPFPYCAAYDEARRYQHQVLQDVLALQRRDEQLPVDESVLREHQQDLERPGQLEPHEEESDAGYEGLREEEAKADEHLPYADDRHRRGIGLGILRPISLGRSHAGTVTRSCSLGIHLASLVLAACVDVDVDLDVDLGFELCTKGEQIPSLRR